MNIYHGSKRLIEQPKYKGSDATNDYGPSFYLTTDLDAAKSWACKNDSVGVVNKYVILSKTFHKFKILDLTNKDKYSVLNWMAILMHFRTLDSAFVRNNKIVLDWLAKYYVDVDEYDVVIGFRADDSYFRFPIRFISNDLSFEDLEDVYVSGHLGIQYAFMSERAIKLLKFTGFINCEESFVGLHKNIVKEAINQFINIIHQKKTTAKTYIFDLIRKDYDKRR